ncbi:hypothetical protein ASF71_20625 [Deinococcus sp. Leaf326]|nr:hypothetical protein ASF71_20625 [Deinococcus sp. Leaf326]
MSRNPDWQMDELILAFDLYVRYGRLGKNDPKVIELSDLLGRLPIHPREMRAANFRNPDGVALKIENLRACDPSMGGKGMWRGGRGDRLVWDLYAHQPEELHQLAEAIREQGNETPEAATTEDEGFPEGRLLERAHKRRERNREVVGRKLVAAKRAGGGRLECEVCGFDFLKFYGPLGEDFAECHHIRPLSDIGPTQTKLSDLAVVCANCHRMIHRSRPLLDVEGLKRVILEHRTLS